jgi:hypothetical protein
MTKEVFLYFYIIFKPFTGTGGRQVLRQALED